MVDTKFKMKIKKLAPTYDKNIKYVLDARDTFSKKHDLDFKKIVKIN